MGDNKYLIDDWVLLRDLKQLKRIQKGLNSYFKESSLSTCE